MSRTDTIITNFLRELHSQESQSLFEHLDQLLNFLEEKEDPDPDELQIVNSLYRTLEQLRTLEEYLKRRVSNRPTLPGNKLQSLYDKSSTYVGSQILFEDN